MLGRWLLLGILRASSSSSAKDCHACTYLQFSFIHLVGGGGDSTNAGRRSLDLRSWCVLVGSCLAHFITKILAYRTVGAWYARVLHLIVVHYHKPSSFELLSCWVFPTQGSPRRIAVAAHNCWHERGVTVLATLEWSLRSRTGERLLMLKRLMCLLRVMIMRRVEGWRGRGITLRRWDETSHRCWAWRHVVSVCSGGDCCCCWSKGRRSRRSRNGWLMQENPLINVLDFIKNLISLS